MGKTKSSAEKDSERNLTEIEPDNIHKFQIKEFFRKRWEAYRRTGSSDLRRDFFWTYLFLLILKKGLIFLAGMFLGFMLTGQGLNFSHSGIIHKIPFINKQWTTYDYIDFQYLTRSYPINGSYNDQILTVQNKWTSEVYTKMEIDYDKEQDGLKIDCHVKNTNESCNQFRINPNGNAVVLLLTINTGNGKKQTYEKVCFKTMEINNGNNFYEACLDNVEITKYR
ncbi:MAG: hypothetical protein NTY22_04530 [Proteobacteria bacterium]|nr:hypothetical protein [Pseudomonadota bacterium]